MEWSLQSFCTQHRQDAVLDHSIHPLPTQSFLAKLGLPSLHPFCDANSHVTDTWLAENEIPPMGPAEIDFVELHEGSRWDALVTRCYMVAPKFMAMGLLWFLLFSAIIAPLGCLYLMTHAHTFQIHVIVPFLHIHCT